LHAERGRALKGEHTILIGDRNRHVREFLMREMGAEGYRIRLAKDAREVIRWIYRPEPLDLVILDLDMPDMEVFNILEELENRLPTLPLVIHTFRTDYADYPHVMAMATFVEKRGDSIDDLKRVVRQVLRKSHSETPDPAKEGKHQSRD